MIDLCARCCCSNIFMYTWSLCCVSDCRSCVLWCRQLSKIATENRQQIAIASKSSATATATTYSSILRAQFIISIVREHRAFARKSNVAAATTYRQTLNIIYSISCAFRSALACSTYAIAPTINRYTGLYPHKTTTRTTGTVSQFPFCVCVCVYACLVFVGLDWTGRRLDHWTTSFTFTWTCDCSAVGSGVCCWQSAVKNTRPQREHEWSTALSTALSCFFRFWC